MGDEDFIQGVMQKKEEKGHGGRCGTGAPREVPIEEDDSAAVNLDGSSMLRIRSRRIYRKSTRRFNSITKGVPHRDWPVEPPGSETRRSKKT